MPTSAPGSRPLAGAAARLRAVTGRQPTPRGACGPAATGGFTLLELLIVIAVMALATGLSILALRDPARQQLEQEAARLTALLEAARIESRTSGHLVSWRPLASGSRTTAAAGAVVPADFLFEPTLAALTGSLGNASLARPSPAWPTRWLHEGTQAEVIGAPRLVLGPEPLIPAQRLRLRLGEQQLVLATDGLGAFRVEDRP